MLCECFLPRGLTQRRLKRVYTSSLLLCNWGTYGLRICELERSRGIREKISVEMSNGFTPSAFSNEGCPYTFSIFLNVYPRVDNVFPPPFSLIVAFSNSRH